MVRIVFGIFILLHGLVHILYFGQSARLFILQPRMLWPEGSWAFGKLLGAETTRLLASISLVLAGLGFITGGIGLFFKQAWFQPVTAGAAIFSTLLFILFWNGKIQNLDSQGAIAILINLAILASLFFILKTFLKV